jgi:hypothetical protein
MRNSTSFSIVFAERLSVDEVGSLVIYGGITSKLSSTPQPA